MARDSIPFQDEQQRARAHHEHEMGRGNRRQSPASPPPALSDNPEVLLKAFLEAAKKLWYQIKRAASFIMVELGGYQAFDKVAQWCVRNPQIAICLLAGGLVMFLPFLILLGFGISTILMTFTGFLVLEGTVLTIISMLLFGCLGALAIVMIFFAIVAVTAYFGFAHIYDLYGGVERHRTALMTFLQSESGGAVRDFTAERNSNATNSNADANFINNL